MQGMELGGYRFVREIGAGGMATVWLAEAGPDVTAVPVGRQVAAKVVHPHLHDAPGFLERFQREVALGTRLQHPNVVRTVDAGRYEADGDTYYAIFMEYVQGQTLRALLDELGRASEQLCRHVGREVARALAAIHEIDSIHRDLKPENVIITSEEVVKVMDFGVALVNEETMRLSRSGEFIGTIRYAAPEQFQAGCDDVDGRADLYALGLMLYELATGAHPFEAEDVPLAIHRQLEEEPARPGLRNPQISPFFEEVLLALLAKRREERPAGARAVLEILEQGEASAWWREREAAIRQVTQRPLRRMRVPRETGLWGRDTEIERLREVWGQAAAGAGRVLLLEGEAGIGKTRLVDEFATRLEREGEDVSFLFGAYRAGGVAAGSRALSDALLEHLGDDGLEARLLELLPDATAQVPVLAARLRGIPLPTGAQGLTRDMVVHLYVRLVHALAAQSPVLLLADDLQFASDESRALFLTLARSACDARLLLLGTARPGLSPDDLATLAPMQHVSRMSLARLGTAEVQGLLAEALGTPVPAAELAETVTEKADGNPRYVFEYLATLKEEGWLVPGTGGAWTIRQGFRSLVMPRPQTLHDLVQSRLDLLDEEERELLEAASCCGFEFDPTLVAEATESGRIPTLRCFNRLERAHHLVHSLGRSYEFDHHHVQEVLYAGLPVPLREAYHAALGMALVRREEEAGREADDVGGEAACAIALHLLRGRRREPVQPYLRSALAYLEEGYGNRRALELARLALEAPDLLEGTDRADVLLARARIGRLAGTTGKGEDDLEEALTLYAGAGHAEQAVETRRELARRMWEGGRSEQAVAVLEEAAAEAARAGNRRLEGSILSDIGHSHAQMGAYRQAAEHYRRHLAGALESGDRVGEATATGNLALNAYEVGKLEEARTHFETCLPLFRELSMLKGEATVTGNLGLVYYDLGRRDDARRCQERHLELSRKMGYRRGEAFALGNLGLVFEAEGNLGAALEHFERDRLIQAEIGDGIHEAQALQLLGDLYMVLGARDLADVHLARSEREFERRGYPWGRAATLCRRGVLRWEEGRPAEAEALLRESERVSREIEKRDTICDALLSLGRILVETDRPDEAGPVLDQALAEARGIPARNQIVLALGWLALLGGDDAAVRAALEEEADRLTLATTMEARFLLWRAAARPADLEKAQDLLAHLERHAPEEYRASLVEGTSLHRAIRAARA